MKAERGYPAVTVGAKAERFIRSGHIWVYKEDVEKVDGEYCNGDIVDVFTKKHVWLGAGFINGNSKILVRLISKNANDRFDAAFWQRRVKYAIDYRETAMNGDLGCCRLIFGDSDGFPGFICDKFGGVLVFQSLSLGMDLRKDTLIPVIIAELRSRGENVSAVYERSDAAVREKEGLSPVCGYFSCDGLESPDSGHTVITENGLKFDVDFINGQKTGYFLDQKRNRAAVADIAKGKHVLDCFTHTGAFAINAAAAGASSVTAVDISATAIEEAKRNAGLNGLSDRIDFIKSDVFELLTDAAASGKRPWDLIILDPPAFTKSASTLQRAFDGYKQINYMAMRILPRGGWLATCSCSHFMTDALFRKMLAEAAEKANVSLLQVCEKQQSPDHPILWGVPETSYLKFYIFRIV
ncbi:MAG: class I SAM-dependent rRNA methyltransferase [Clostridia bacterium]|nr:class I SAM-dependent rRNA methyltransferase [Clostridia bacterium]